MSRRIPPQHQAALAQVFALIAQVPPVVREAIAEEALKSQRQVKPWHYYSKGRFRAARTGADPFTYTIDTTDRVLFAYKQGDSLVPAGFSAADGTATESETNVLAGGQTRNNETVFIYGMGAHIGEMSEPLLAQGVWDQVHMRMAMNGNENHELGKLSFYPSGGGLYGQATSRLLVPNLGDTLSVGQGFLANGNPQWGNHFRLNAFNKNAIFKWQSIGSDNVDTSLSVTLTPKRSVAVTTLQATRAAVAGAGATAAWTPPADQAQGTWVDVMIHLFTVGFAKRSLNV